MKLTKECGCEEMSCKEGCELRHTHKGFWCEKCHPERYEPLEEKKCEPDCMHTGKGFCPYCHKVTPEYTLEPKPESWFGELHKIVEETGWLVIEDKLKSFIKLQIEKAKGECKKEFDTSEYHNTIVKLAKAEERQRVVEIVEGMKKDLHWKKMLPNSAITFGEGWNSALQDLLETLKKN